MTPMDSSGSTSQSEAKEQVTANLRRDRYDGSSIRTHVKNSVVRRESNCQFPQMKEFTHFHYDQVEFGTVKLEIDSSSKAEVATSLIAVQVVSQERFWTVHRGFEHFLTLDVYLHRCIYDRQISQLPDISQYLHLDEQEQLNMLMIYLSRLSELIGMSGSMVNCGTVLNFFELDNHGRRLMAAEDSAINIPAIAAAHCVQRYIAQASDELSLEVGDMVSVIDMPPVEDTNWWRGKKNFEVGLFPAECVEVIGGRTLPQQLGSSAEQVKPVLRRRGKIISFLRMFFSNRPQRSVLKQSGIVKERVFGCDLGEHLLNSGLQVPYVLTNCIEFVETFGMTDGIYRLTGVTSNVQKLRFNFDEGTIIDLSQQEYLSDLHSVTAVLKMYFRELPNPLLTYHLYGDFATTLHYKDEERLRRMQEVVRRLPPPNYRTAKRLFTHLHKMAQNVAVTNMDTRNLAIVWAPNLMRCKALDNAGSNVSGMSVLNSVSLQATVTEFMISHADLIFTDDQAPTTSEISGASRKPRPTSMVLAPPGRLLSLAEAQGRLLQLQGKTGVRPVELASIAMNVNPVYHTIIEFPGERGASKLCISPLSRRRVRSGNAKKEKAVMAAAASWKAIFSKHAGSIGLKSRHKEKTKAAEDGTESEDDQQLSEIGHLSRQTQQGSLPSVKKAVDDEPVGGEGRRVRLLSERSLLEDSDGNPSPRSAPPSHTSESNLVRSASHESFFDGDMASVGTPGVVFRPAYKESTAHDLVQPLPSATWRRTKFHSKSPPPVSQPRIPYVPTPNVGGSSDRVEPYVLQRSPSVGRRSVICLSPDNEVSDPSQPPSAVSAVPPPACTPGLAPDDDLQCRSGHSSSSIAFVASGPSTSDGTSTNSVSRSRRPVELGRAGSLDNLGTAATNVAGEDSQTKESTSGSSEQLRELMSHWESSDRLLVATQGLSARTHRLPQAALHDRLSPPAPSPRAVACQSDTAQSDVLAALWRSQPASTAGASAADADSCAMAVGFAAPQQQLPTTESHGDGTVPSSVSVPSSSLLLAENKLETRGDELLQKSSSDCCSGSSSCASGTAACNVGRNQCTTSSPSGSISSSSTCSTSSGGSGNGSAGVRWRRKHQPAASSSSSSDAAADSQSGSSVGASLEGASQSAVPSCGRPIELDECSGGGAAVDDHASLNNGDFIEPPVDATRLHFCGSSASIAAAGAGRDPEAATAAATIELADRAESHGTPSLPAATAAAVAATVHAAMLRSPSCRVPSLPVDGNKNCSNRSENCSDNSAQLCDVCRPTSPPPPTLQLPDSADSPAATVESEVQASVADLEAADAAVVAVATWACRDVQAVAAESDASNDAAASPTVAQLAFQYETGTARREAVLAFSLPPAAGAGVSPRDPLTSHQPATSSVIVAPLSMAETPRLQQREHCDADDGPPPHAAAAAVAAAGDGSYAGSANRGAGKPPKPQPRLSLRLSHANSSHASDAAAADAATASPRIVAHSQQRRAVLPLQPPPRLPSPSEGTLTDDAKVQPPAASEPMTDGKAIRASAAVSPGQCAFRWIGSPAAMELPSPASAAVAVPPLPLPNFVRHDEPLPSDATSRQPVAADAGTASDATTARDASSASAKTSALYAAVILEATRPIASPSHVVTLASPDITDAFMAFSGV